MGWYYVKPDLIILTLMWRWLIFEVIWNLAQNTIASEIRTFAHRAHLWWTACKKNTALIWVFIDKVYVNQHLRQYWKRNLYLVWVFTFSTLNTISHIQTENGVKFWYIWKLIGERKIDSIKSRTHAWIWICSKLFLWYSKYLAKTHPHRRGSDNLWRRLVSMLTLHVIEQYFEWACLLPKICYGKWVTTRT